MINAKEGEKMLLQKMSSLVVLSVLAIGLMGCGGGSSGGNSIDLADYMPKENMLKSYNEKKKYLDGHIESIDSIEIVTVSVVDGYRVVTQQEEGSLDRHIIYDNNISTYNSRNELTDVSERYADVGDTTVLIQDILFMNGERMDFTYECTVDEEINSFLENPDGTPFYTGDMLKIKCIMSIDDPVTIDGVSYNYSNTGYFVMKRDKGLVAKVDISCVVNSDNGIIDDNNLSACPANQIEYSIKLWDEEGA